MARRQPLYSYPARFFKLFHIASKKRLVLSFASPEAASSERNSLYTFRSVLYENWEEQPELARKAQNVRLKLLGSQLIATPILPSKEETTDE